MKKRELLKHFASGLFLLAFIFVINSCNSDEETIYIKNAFLAKGSPGGKFEKVGTTFHSDDGPFYLFVELENALDSTNIETDSSKIKASWYVVKVNNEQSGLINETEFSFLNENQLKFTLAFPHPWLPGKYKVDICFNGILDRSITFDVIE